MNRRSLVVLLKSLDAEDSYAAALDAAGYEATFVDVLSYRYLDVDRLAAHAALPARYQAMALTSPRAVAALEVGPTLRDWAGRPVFAVGPSTATAAERIGMTVHPETPGTAEELAAVIIRSGIAGPVLFPCGNRRRDALPRALRAAGIAVEEVLVYETRLLPPEMPSAPIAWVVFFSPSGVEAARAASAFPWNRLRTAAIGPTTAAALAASPVPASAVAAEPTPDALAEALLHADSAR